MSEIVWAVNPRKDRFRDLAQHMREFAGDILVPQNIGLRFDASRAAGDQRLGMDVRRQIFLVFKECIHNIARHSGGTQAIVELTVEGNWLTLKVSDNGRGYDPWEQRVASAPTGGNGLENMRRRARSLGGEIELIRLPNCGVTAILHVPIARRWLSGLGHPPKYAG
jgi:signal transduction histidine kinase